MPESRIAAISAYAELIERRRREPADPERDGYCEKHHACPKSLGGGEGDNLVLLPVREHIRTHIELARAIGDQKWGRGMASAANMMTNGNNSQFSTIDEAAEARALKAMAQRGVAASDRSKAATAERNRNRVWRQESISKLSEANLGKAHTAEARAKMSAAHRGRPKSAAHVEKVAAALRNPEVLSFEHVATGERKALTRTEARRQLGLSNGDISSLIAGRQKTSHGYRLMADRQVAA